MKSCWRCGYTEKLELHHKKHKRDGGSDKSPNRVWLCTCCHDYQHAKDAVVKAIKIEEKRLKVLHKRLEIIETSNTPEEIIRRGRYQPYFEIYNETLQTNGNKCLMFSYEEE